MADSKSLCMVHYRGRSPGQAVPYVPTCTECVTRRGHLPEGQRDVPGSGPRIIRRGFARKGPRLCNADCRPPLVPPGGPVFACQEQRPCPYHGVKP